MPPIPNAPMKQFDIPIVTCSICRDNQTVARSATSYTLKPWHVVSYPNDCHCPRCSGIKKPADQLAEDEPPPPRKRGRAITSRADSNAQKYYRVAKQLGEFSTSDIVATDLPNTKRAGAYLWGLVASGKLINIGKARFAVAPPTPRRKTS